MGAIVLHIGLSLLIYRVVTSDRCGTAALAYGIHFLVDFFAIACAAVQGTETISGGNEVNYEMDFRLAVMQDLLQLKAVYRQIVNHMNDQGIQIWDDIYPLEFLAEDIEKQRLYVLVDNGKITSAFALCDTNEGEKTVQWKENSAKALYIDRLGVDVRYAKRGIGSFMLAKAKESARVSGAEYLRLFVVDVNEPAIKLYIKNGFIKADGVFSEVFDDGFTLHEYGYEIEV